MNELFDSLQGENLDSSADMRGKAMADFLEIDEIHKALHKYVRGSKHAVNERIELPMTEPPPSLLLFGNVNLLFIPAPGLRLTLSPAHFRRRARRHRCRSPS